MPSPLVLVPTADGAIEAARLIDAAGIPIASVLEPGAGVAHLAMTSGLSRRFDEASSSFAVA